MRIVLAEDQILLRDGIRRLLAAAGHDVVGEVGDARSLIATVNEQRPDLVVSDVRMPPGDGEDGAQAIVYLRTRMPGLPVVVLSQYVEPRLLGLTVADDATSFGYLLKDKVLDTTDFLRQLEQVAAGGTVIDADIVARALESGPRSGVERLAVLTARELEILRAVATGRSNPGIAADLVISRRTVDAHLRSIFHKLGIAAGPDDNQRVLATLTWLGV